MSGARLIVTQQSLSTRTDVAFDPANYKRWRRVLF